jgi:hypothetical protein
MQLLGWGHGFVIGSLDFRKNELSKSYGSLEVEVEVEVE